jgi:methionyl-tRNA formyltransferase
MPKIVFFGNEQLAQGLDEPITPTFDGLVASKNSVVALVLPRRAEAVSRKAKTLKIVDSAEQRSVQIIYANEVDLVESLRALKADIGVLVSYGKIISQAVIDVFPRGIANLHPSLLPQYRGPTPIESAIVNGDRETGVSLMSLTAGMDSGPVYAQTKIAISPEETKFSLYRKALLGGSKLLLDSINDIVSGELQPSEQDSSQATYTSLLTKADGDLDPATMTAIECERKIRAYLGWPKTRLELLGKEVIVTHAQVLPDYAGDSWPDVIKCAGSSYLQIRKIISPKTGKTTPLTDYLRGIKST